MQLNHLLGNYHNWGNGYRNIRLTSFGYRFDIIQNVKLLLKKKLLVSYETDYYLIIYRVSIFIIEKILLYGQRYRWISVQLI